MKCIKKIGIALCAVALCASVRAETAKVGQYTYTYRVVDGKAELSGSPAITSYGNDGKVASTKEAVDAITPRPSGVFNLPAQLDGLPVTLGDYALFSCRTLTSIIIPNGVTITGKSVFWESVKLSRIVVDANHSQYVARDGVLYDKMHNTLMCFPADKSGPCNISEGVVNIHPDAFSQCSKMTSITLPASLRDSMSLDWSTIFFYCENLSSILVTPNHPTLASVNGVLFDKTKTTLVRCPPKRAGTYTIPNGVQMIGNGAFSDCKELSSVVIPEGMTSIGHNAFNVCRKLTSVTIPKSVTFIGNYAFHICTKLTTVNLNCAKPAQNSFGVFNDTSVQKLIVPKDMGWTDGEMFGGKPVEIRN